MSDKQDLVFFEDRNIDRAVGLVFELAAQLHVERQRNRALEKLLRDKGVIEKGEMDALTGDQEFLEASRAELDASLRKLMRVITEEGDETGPLRGEALDSE